ncbi:hypothetical protein BD410DRAFT_727211 [Rickenella mellea]|uniref:DUF1308 domain-containing protein n=1 Tax=Rickenella mellea TaxID=50990 RepID=A0A4Y7PWV8_9AGAM|nr:hypothetical protein BD410DRAFT_727211 [Rickenella mellea]
MDADRIEGLKVVGQQLQSICESMPNFGQRKSRIPIIDSSAQSDNPDTNNDLFQHPGDSIQGLKVLRDNVQRDLEALDKYLAQTNRAELPPPSTNAPYLIAVWNEVLCAPPPVNMVGRTFSTKGSVTAKSTRSQPKASSIKVDVVADEGRRWIRVNTVKNSRLLAEFREIDSYLTDSEESDSAPSSVTIAHNGIPQTGFDNSILKMGRLLVAAAQANPIDGTDEIPKVTLRLTRLEPGPKARKELLGSGLASVNAPLHTDDEETESEVDPRIAQTIKGLLNIGIEVVLGERPFQTLEIAPNAEDELTIPPPVPTRHINLDLSVLIALVSDMTHAPLPPSIDEAHARYVPNAQERERIQQRREKRKGKVPSKPAAAVVATDRKAHNETNEKLNECAGGEGSPHSRVLTHKLLNEMRRGLLDEISDRLQSLSSNSPSSPSVEFWTTPEARDRCLRIVSKIGGDGEKRRANALFNTTGCSVEEAERAYWQDSRHPLGFVPLLPIRVYDAAVPPLSFDGHALGIKRTSQNDPFWIQLRQTCQRILSQDIVRDPRTTRILARQVEDLCMDGENDNDKDDQDGEVGDADDGDEIQRAAVTKVNLHLTAHTVQSLLWGAELGWTTMTANRSSVKTILREMRAVKSGKVNVESDGELNCATIWVIEPRSLAEGMRNT